jgi:hypothetical protein
MEGDGPITARTSWMDSPVATNRASSAAGMASRPTTRYSRRIGSLSTTSPRSTKRSALRISSRSSQNVSRCWRERSDMANARPWLPTSSPAVTMVIGADRCRCSADAQPPVTRAREMRISSW